MNLKSLTPKIEKIKALVIGDIILDEYLFSEIERISPEAPVPIARVTKVEKKLGGAANVALNLKALGANVCLMGLLGQDEPGKKIKSLLKDKKIKLVASAPRNYKTTVKTRVICRGSHLIRIDQEEKNFRSSREEFLNFAQLFKKISSKYDLVVISDYKKGTVNQKIIDIAVKSRKIVSIDTKSGDLILKGLNFVKLNFNEAKKISNHYGDLFDYKNTDIEIEKLGRFLKSKLFLDILITRGEMGATYIGKEIFHHREKILEVKDVTGAGDTCTAIFSVLTCLGLEPSEALKAMSLAAKVTISHVGTYAPSLKEIIQQEEVNDNSKILNHEGLIKKILELKKKKKKIVFTNGCFDILHKGHVAYLEEAKKLGDILIIGLNSDSSVRKLKGEGRPIIDEESRAFVLSRLDFVDYVIIFSEDTPENLIKIIRPEIHVKGGDYKKEDLPEAKLVESLGGTVKIIPLKSSLSTSKIIKKIKNDPKSNFFRS